MFERIPLTSDSRIVKLVVSKKWFALQSIKHIELVCHRITIPPTIPLEYTTIALDPFQILCPNFSRIFYLHFVSYRKRISDFSFFNFFAIVLIFLGWLHPLMFHDIIFIGLLYSLQRKLLLSLGIGLALRV